MSDNKGRFLAELGKGEVEGREQKAGLHPRLCLRLEKSEQREGDKSLIVEGTGMLYGNLLGAPYFLPGKGIQFVFQGACCINWGHWVFCDWQVSILPAPGTPGTHLYTLWHQISESKLDFLRFGKGLAILSVEVTPAEIVGREAPEVS